MVYDQQIRSSTRLGIGGVIKVNKVSAVLTALLSGDRDWGICLQYNVITRVASKI